MANRLVGSVYIVDSQTGAAASFQPGSASWQQHSMKVQSVALWCADTTSTFELVWAADTASVAVRLAPQTAPVPSAGSLVNIEFPNGINFDELRCKTLVAGTGFIYFA